MKKILLIALIICMAGSVGAATITVIDYRDLGTLNATAVDDIIVALGGYVNADVSVTIHSLLIGGGTWSSAGGRKIKTAGFSMTSGTTTLGPSDTIEISNQNIFNTHDFYIGAGTANFAGSAANPVVIRTDPTTYGNGSVMVTGASAVLNWSNVKFVNMSDPGSGLNTAGVNFQTRTTPTNNSITNMSGDTASFATYNCTGFKWYGGTVVVVNGQDQGLVSYGGSADTIIGVKVTTDSQNGFYSVQNGTYYIADTATALSPTTGAYGFTLCGGTKNGKVLYCKVQGFFGCLAIPTNSRHDSLYVYSSRFDGGAATHTLCLLGLTKGTKIVCSQFYGGTTRLTVGTYDGSVVEDLKLYYNTIGGQGQGQGWVKAPICFDCITGYNCVATITGLEMVGNIVFGKNPGFANADIWVSGGLNVQLTRFQHNALDKIDTSSAGAHFAIPVGSWPGTNKVTSNFGFLDSANWDFRLAPGSPMLNCADSAIFTQYMGGVNQPGDIGYYQSNITGACGGVPTGACCYPPGTCAEVTGATCTAGGGTYYGDGTTCPQTTCNIPTTTGPAPRSKQLDIALLAYYGPMWQSNFGGYVPAMRDWAAQRYSMIITTAGGTTDSTSMAYMKTINTNLKIIGYDLYSRVGTDSANIAAYSASSGIPVDSMFLRTGPEAADSAVVVGNTNTTASYTTPGGNKFIRMYMYAQDALHLRYLFDPRKWQFGSYLYHRFNISMLDNGLDGIMMDEETRLTGLWPNNAGYQPYTAADWPVGLDSIASPFTGIDIADMPDSQVVWRDRWAQTLADSMAAHNKILIPNGASWWGLQASQADSGWKVEGRHATNIYGGAFLNETMSQFYSYAYGVLRYQPAYAYQMKDSAVNLVLGYWPVGWIDSVCQAAMTLARQRMNFLGARLMCEFPRTNGSKLWMFPRWQSGQYAQDANDFYHNWTYSRSYVCASMVKPSDSDWLWSDAYGKYFGTAMNTRDTLQTGTDGSGTTYKVWKAAFLDPLNVADTLTFAAMRFPYGSYGAGIYGATTEIDVTLPGSVAKVWWELIDNYGDSAGLGGAHTCFWKPVQQLGGSTFTLRNGQARVFSSDTVLSNSGVIDTTLVVSPATTTEGQNMVFTVTQNRALSNRNYFAWHTTGGTAQSNVDFTAMTDVIGSIGPGELTTTLSVPTTDDVLVEGNETFTVTINSQTYGTIVTGTATGTIIDNDAQGQPGSAKHFPGWRKKQ